MGCKAAGMHHPLRLLLLQLLCVLSWRVCPILAELCKESGSSFTTDDKPSAFWLSPNGECTFGFQRTSSNAYLLSLWFTKDPDQTPIWWPSTSPNNLEKPEVQKGALFRFTKEASLELWAVNAIGDFAVVWSEVGSMGRCGFAEVTDTCNLVVYDLQGKVQLWQSYADSRDSLMLPSYGKGFLDDRARVIEKPYLLQSKRNYASFAPGRFRVSSNYKQDLVLYATLDSQYHYNSGTNLETEYIYRNALMNVSTGFQIKDADGKLGFSNNGTNMAEVNRLTLSEDGNLKIYSWESKSWRMIWQMVDDKCKLASPCGPFAICKGGMNDKVQCTCPFDTSNVKPTIKASRKLVTMQSAAKVPLRSLVTSSIKDSEQTCGSKMGFVAIDCTTPLGVVNLYNFSMLEVADSSYYYNDLKPYIPDVSLEDCKDSCLQMCECMAVSYAASPAGMQCTLKGSRDMYSGLLMNGYESIGTTSLIKVGKLFQPLETTSTDTAKMSSVTAKMSSVTAKMSSVTGGLIISAGIGPIVVLATVVGCLWMITHKRKSLVQGSAHKDTELNIARENGRPKRFTYKEILQATNRFSNWLGEGGFGKVYKGCVNAEKDWITQGTESPSGRNTCLYHQIQEQVEQKEEKKLDIEEGPSTPCQVVAVKVLKGFSYDDSDDSDDRTSSKDQKHVDAGEKQFKAEVTTLGKIHHINLVSLLGYCATRRHGGHHAGKRILVYEYMENGSLEKYLTMPALLQEDYLPWHVRYSIALDTARGIAYLHHDCNPPIIHCDIKPQNVLLDQNFCAKVADFGLACALEKQQSHLTITGVRGTRGYLAPEWLNSQEVTSKVDVFSYGMLLLELVYASELVENAPGVIVNRLTLLDWALQSVSAATETGVTSNIDALSPPPQADYSAEISIVQGGIAASSINESSFNMDESTSKPGIPCNSAEDMEPSELIKDRYIVDGAPPAGNENEEKLRLLKIGLWCVQFIPTMRPSMLTVVQLLQRTIPVANPPNPNPHPRLVPLPSFLISESSTFTSSQGSSNSGSSNSKGNPLLLKEGQILPNFCLKAIFL